MEARWAFLFLLVLLVPSAYGDENIIPGSRYTSARGAAMGGAFLPLGDDGASGLFYNPADIAKNQGTHLDLFNLSLYGDAGYLNNFNITSGYKILSLSGYEPILAANPGQIMGIGGAFVPTYSMKGFAFGLMTQSQMWGVVNHDGTITYRSLYQLIPTVGTGLRLADGIVRIGYSLQWVNEAAGMVTGTSATSYTNGIAEGSTFSNNLGFALTLPVTYLPSFNLVARNLLGASYNSVCLIPVASNPSGPPPFEASSYDASLSIEPKISARSGFNIVVEYQDLTNVSNVTPIGHLATGIEFHWMHEVYLRAGYGTGYPSAGIGFAHNGSALDFAWYSMDVGATYHALQDTRYLLQYQARAF